MLLSRPQHGSDGSPVAARASRPEHRGAFRSRGIFDVSGAALLLFAVRRGLVSIVAALGALAPGFTVVLAWAVLREHLSVRQRVGLAVALVGLVLVATG